MTEPKLKADSARVYTTHGSKRNMGKLAMVNSKMALAYTEGKGENEHIVGYTFMDEMISRCLTGELPQYRLDF